MEIVIQITQFILSLSLLIVLHEMGHMLPAKYFKTKVEKFYLFFDAGFSLFKVKRGETEYGIGWIPLGGYVKIAGMIDESMDKEQLKEPAKPWEFRAKPAWQRLIIMVGGVTVNLLLGYLIYIMILFVWGTDYLPNNSIKYGAQLSDPSFEEYGFKNGDLITSVDGEKIIEFGDAEKMILIEGKRNIEINRNGKIIPITISDSIISDLLRLKVSGIFSYPRFPNVVDSILPGNNAELAGFQIGDSIVAVNGNSMFLFDDFREKLNEFSNENIEVSFYRNGILKTLSVNVNEDHMIGYSPKHRVNFYDLKHREYGFIEAIPAGIITGTKTLGNYVKSLSLIFNKEGAKQIGGFGTIGKLFPTQWNWEIFWKMTALLSIILAFMNILPIPALDGGHVMFLVYEMITGRPPSDKFLTSAQLVGMTLLFGLLIYANGMDIYRWIIG
jgi:regulator of sigma E protease